jgi:hypothetical protein
MCGEVGQLIAPSCSCGEYVWVWVRVCVWVCQASKECDARRCAMHTPSVTNWPHAIQRCRATPCAIHATHHADQRDAYVQSHAALCARSSSRKEVERAPPSRGKYRTNNSRAFVLCACVGGSARKHDKDKGCLWRH